MSENANPLRYESQQERWIKYGGNVVLASVVVVLIAILVIWLSQEANARVDTTTSGMYSLKPQTINLVKDNKQKITLVSLYTRARKKDPDAVERRRVRTLILPAPPQKPWSRHLPRARALLSHAGSMYHDVPNGAPRRT